jgi:lysosomal alpha-mannosidase
MVESLVANPERKFSEVEMAFFKRWYDKQNDKTKQDVKNLITNGQLEILNAGWSMHDEACPIYEDMINNMMHG